MIVIYNDVCEGIKKLNLYDASIHIHQENVTTDSFKLKSLIYDVDNEILRQSYSSNNELIRRIYEGTIHPQMIDEDYDAMLTSIYTMISTYPDAIDYTNLNDYLSQIDEINASVMDEKNYCNDLIDSYDEIANEYKEAFSEVKFIPRSYQKYE